MNPLALKYPNGKAVSRKQAVKWLPNPLRNFSSKTKEHQLNAVLKFKQSRIEL